MRLIDAEPIIKNLSSMKTQLGCDAIDIDGMIKALREVEVVTDAYPPNDPLTLEELRGLDVFEWLWVEIIIPTKRQTFYGTKSAYYQVFEDYADGNALCCGWPGTLQEFEYDGYGKSWVAFRRRPEEGTE